MTGSERLLLLLLASTQFCHIVDFMIVMPLGPQLMSEFGLTTQFFSLLVAGYTFAAGIMGVLGALFLDRFDRKSVLIFFFSGFCLGTIACGFATSGTFLLICRALTGAFGGILTSIAYAIVADAIAPERRGTAMGYITYGFSVASIAGVPLALFLSTHFNWRTPFFALGGFAMIVWMICIWKVPSIRGHLENRQAATHWWAPYQRAWSVLNQRRALLFIFFLVLGHFSVIPLISATLVTNTGFSTGELTLMYLLGGLSNIIVGPQVGKLTDRLGRKKVFAYGCILSLFPIFTVTLLSTEPHWLILIITSLFFILMGARMIPAMTIVSSAVQARERGSFMSLSNSLLQFACAVGAFISGLIVVQDASGKMIHYVYCGGLAIVFSLIALQISKPIVSAD